MSCDFLVWHPEKRVNSKEAQNLYLRLCESDVSGVSAHPGVDAFYAELTAKHPEIDTIPEERIDDHDYCPWSCALDHSPAHVILSCVWPKANYVGALVAELARKHGLALYDPQSDQVTYADGTSSRGEAPSRTALWILLVFAVVFAAMLAYSGFLSTGRVAVVMYLFAVLCGLLAVACLKQALKK